MPEWKDRYSPEEISDYFERKVQFVYKCVSASVISLEEAWRDYMLNDIRQALMEISDEVIKVCETIPSRQGIMMNGGQPIGFISCEDIVKCPRTEDAYQERVRDWTITEHCEQLMRAIGFDQAKKDSGGFWHGVSPGQGMRFLQKMSAKKKYYNALANLFDVSEAGTTSEWSPNLTKSAFTITTAQALVATGCKLVEIEETEGDNPFFLEAMLYASQNGQVYYYADDFDVGNHPLREFLEHPVLKPFIRGAKISATAVMAAQLEMFNELKQHAWMNLKEGIDQEQMGLSADHLKALNKCIQSIPLKIPQRWREIVADMAPLFSTIVIEGSDTMMLENRRPVVEERTQLINLDLQKCLAEEMLTRWGDKARIGHQSFRQLAPGESVSHNLIPAGWLNSQTNWGEAAVPLSNVTAVMGLPRHLACGVKRVKRA